MKHPPKTEIVEIHKPGQKPRSDFAKFKETWDRTQSYFDAMVAAGHSEKVARQGYSGLSAREKDYVDGKGKDAEPEVSSDELRAKIDAIKTPEDMVSLLKDVTAEFLFLKKAVPKGLGEIMKVAGQLKGLGAFSNGERGEGIFHVHFPSAEQVAAAFGSKSPLAEEWEEKDFEAGPATLYPLPGLPNWYSDRRGTEVRISVLSALPAGSMKAESGPTAEEAFFSEELPPLPLQN